MQHSEAVVAEPYPKADMQLSLPLKAPAVFSVTSADKLLGFIAAVFFSCPGNSSWFCSIIFIKPPVTKFEGGRRR